MPQAESDPRTPAELNEAITHSGIMTSTLLPLRFKNELTLGKGQCSGSLQSYSCDLGVRHQEPPQPLKPWLALGGGHVSVVPQLT